MIFRMTKEIEELTNNLDLVESDFVNKQKLLDNLPNHLNILEKVFYPK